MVALGVILLVLGFFFHVGILFDLGVVLLVIGAVLWVLGASGHAVGGRRWY